MSFYRFLDIFFIVFHTHLIFFNLFGWIFRPLRTANLIVLLLTGGSWFILGIFYGIGYCPLTEFHWEVLHKLGQNNLPDSYISYLIQRFTGFLPGARITDILTLVFYFMALAASIYINFKSKKRTE
ncbi:MAG: DUF2784 family protein [Bacteroidales bacterium]|jgi:hypothetical protein